MISSSSIHPSSSESHRNVPIVSSFRKAIGKELCVVSVTALPEVAPMTSTIAQLSIQTSKCFASGSLTSDRDPRQNACIARKVPDAIVFHAAHDVKAALGLFEELGNGDVLRSRYQAQPGGYAYNAASVRRPCEVPWRSAALIVIETASGVGYRCGMVAIWKQPSRFPGSASTHAIR